MSTTAKITITLDYRERDLHAKMLELLAQNQTLVNKIQLSSPVNLDVGDIIIAMADYGSYLIERKRIDDMSSSIKDGRYAEQKARCQSYIVQQQQATAGSGPCNLVYLLEGTMDICRSSADYTLVQGSWISLALRDKVPVIRVLTMEEGCKWLIRLCEQAEYLTTVKTKKKDNITPATCAILMLAVIPGMTTGTAQVILEQLGAGTLPGLISALSISAGTPEEQSSMIKMKKKVLAELVIKPGRRLGPALADKVWDYLFNISS